MIHYIVANSALVSVGAGLLRVQGDSVIDLFVALIFIAGTFTSVLGIRAIRKGHEYYRRTIRKKVVIEDLLGLTTPLIAYGGATLAIATTTGQAQVLRTLNDVEDSLSTGRPKRGSVVHAAALTLRLLLCMNIIGVFVALILLWYHLPHIRWMFG